MITEMSVDLPIKRAAVASDMELVSARIVSKELRDDGDICFSAIAVERGGRELKHAVSAGGRMNDGRSEEVVLQVAIARLTDYFNLVQGSVTDEKLRKQLFIE